MEKKLLLLGMLEDGGEVCRYLMSPDLEGTNRVGFPLRKANSYRLLSEMEKLGWIRVSGKKPDEQFAITEEGSKAFYNLQKKRLGALALAEVPNAVALNHLHLMNPSDIQEGLSERIEQLYAHVAMLEAVPAQIRKKKNGIELLHRLYLTELLFMEELLKADN